MDEAGAQRLLDAGALGGKGVVHVRGCSGGGVYTLPQEATVAKARAAGAACRRCAAWRIGLPKLALLYQPTAHLSTSATASCIGSTRPCGGGGGERACLSGTGMCMRHSS